MLGPDQTEHNLQNARHTAFSQGLWWTKLENNLPDCEFSIEHDCAHCGQSGLFTSSHFHIAVYVLFACSGMEITT